MLTVIEPLAAGEQLALNGKPLTVTAALGIGHKVAAEAIAVGAKIVKYGAAIGSATRDISPGEHVHTHNVQSDYLPTFLREDQGRYFSQGQHQQQQ